MAAVGPWAFMALAAKTKQQSCVSHPTPEAEIVSVNLALRTLGMPALSVWDFPLGREGGLDVMEDNDATIAIAKARRSPALRCVSRAHGVNVSWFHEVCPRPEGHVHYQPTLGQHNDSFTIAVTTAVA